MDQPRSRLQAAAHDVADVLGLLIDWASLTRIGRLNVTGLLAALAAAGVWGADGMAAGAGSGARGWLVLGTLSLPLYGMGYWHVAAALGAASPRAAALIRLSGIFAAAVGTAAHALLAPAIAAPVASTAALGEMVSAHPLLPSLLVAVAAAVLIASVAFSWSVLATNAPYPAAVAAASPAVLIAAAAILGVALTGWGSATLLVAPHVGHLLFFSVSVAVLEWRNPERWS